ncbi:MAG TPA: hypothetical protein VFS65_00100, partial [Candidatus Saccharimonadales bacterium]|nr:hypothetical protein [Candidatus Saccharimonadales bacterium]
TGTGRGARRAASVFGAEDSIKNRKGAIDAEYKTRNDRLRNTAGTADNAFNVRQENATQESQTIDSELKATQRQRVATTPDLNNVEMRMRAAQDSSKRFDAQLDREFKTNVANDAVLTGVVQETKDAEFGSKALDAEQDATFNLRTESDAGLVASSQMIHEAEQQSSASQATVKAAREQEAQLDSGMINLRQQQENAEAEVTGITTERATELRERTVTDTNLRNLDINRRANEQAAKEATDESLSLYGQAVSTDGSTTQLRAGGTINPEQGQAKAAAFGIDAQRSLRAENVKAAGSAIDQAGLSSQQLVDELRANETSGYTRLTPEQEEAYVRAVVATNNVDRIADANDYVVAQARTSIDPATGAPMRPTENVLALEQAFGSAIAGSSAKPKFIGGAQLDQYKAGTMGASSDELVVITAGANKLTKSSFGGMDIDEMKRMTRVLGDERKVEQLTEAQRQGLAAIVNAALIDPIANSNFGDRETAELTRLSGILTQGLTPPPSNTPPPPTPPSAPTPRDVFGPGGSAGNTP